MDGLDIPRTVVVTGHFPPESGGVQTFTYELVRRLPADRIVLIAPAWPGAADFDATLDFPVIRRHGYLLFRGLRRIARRHRASAAWIPALAPFGLYAPLVRAAGIGHIVASTHGQELGWIRAWPTRLALGAATHGVDIVTYLNQATLAELRPVVDPRTRLVHLAGGVDPGRFGRGGHDGGPVVVTVSRLVRRKGHDVLLRAWAQVLSRVPDARLVIVGDGPLRRSLAEQAARHYPGSVTVTGPVSDAELPSYYAAADVFVLPCRDDRRGLQTEGLGLVTLEAAAAGLPVVVGRSGGSPESLRPGETGLLIDARTPDAVAAALLHLLENPRLARAMGEAGRRWVERTWSWDAAAARLAAALQGRDVEARDHLSVQGR